MTCFLRKFIVADTLGLSSMLVTSRSRSGGSDLVSRATGTSTAAEDCTGVRIEFDDEAAKGSFIDSSAAVVGELEAC